MKSLFSGSWKISDTFIMESSGGVHGEIIWQNVVDFLVVSLNKFLELFLKELLKTTREELLEEFLVGSLEKLRGGNSGGVPDPLPVLTKNVLHDHLQGHWQKFLYNHQDSSVFFPEFLYQEYLRMNS